MTQKLKNGFTLIELTIAMSIFSVMLLLAVIAFNNLIDSYGDNVATRDTQQAALSAVADISLYTHSAYQVAIITNPTTTQLNYVCLLEPGGEGAEYYVPTTGSNPIAGGLWRISFTGSQCPGGSPSGGTLVTPRNVSITRFIPFTTSSTPQTLSIEMTVAITNASPGATAGLAQCQSNASYCSVFTINNTISLQGSLQ